MQADKRTSSIEKLVAVNESRTTFFAVFFSKNWVGRAMGNEIFHGVHGDSRYVQRYDEIKSAYTFLLSKISKCLLNLLSNTFAEVSLHDYLLERMAQLTLT